MSSAIVREIQPINYWEQEWLAEVGAKSSSEVAPGLHGQVSVWGPQIERAFATNWLNGLSLEMYLSAVHPKLQVTGVRFPMRIFIAFNYKCQDKHWHVVAHSNEKLTAQWRAIKFDRSRPSGKNWLPTSDFIWMSIFQMFYTESTWEKNTFIWTSDKRGYMLCTGSSSCFCSIRMVKYSKKAST